VEQFPIQRNWYVCYLAGKQLSVIADAFLKYLLEASQTIPINASLKNGDSLLVSH
jgi:hypothetical protein